MDASAIGILRSLPLYRAAGVHDGSNEAATYVGLVDTQAMFAPPGVPTEALSSQFLLVRVGFDYLQNPSTGFDSRCCFSFSSIFKQ